MSEYKDFKKDFVLRTREIIETTDKETKYDVTLLLNCLLGLLAYPIESLSDLRSDSKDTSNMKANVVSDSQHMKFIISCLSTKLVALEIRAPGETDCDGWRNQSESDDEYSLYRLSCFRNAIAHCHIDTESCNGEISSIRLRDINPYKPFVEVEKTDGEKRELRYHFQKTFSVQELRDFALHVAKQYVEIYFGDSDEATPSSENEITEAPNSETAINVSHETASQEE